MLAENLENLVKKERAEGIEQGIEQGYQKAQAELQAAEKRLQEMVLNMLQAGLPDCQVIEIAQITEDELAAIKRQQTRH